VQKVFLPLRLDVNSQGRVEAPLLSLSVNYHSQNNSRQEHSKSANLCRGRYNPNPSVMWTRTTTNTQSVLSSHTPCPSKTIIRFVNNSSSYAANWQTERQRQTKAWWNIPSL